MMKNDMTDLSPAAQAVLDAYNAGFTRPLAVHHKPRIAAALRAVASQMVVPLPRTPSEYDIAQYDGREEAIANLLSIADELETA
jgi:hypothetical protein